MQNFLKTLLNHERYQTISCLLVGLLLAFFYSCQPTCRSPLDPEIEITRAQLDMEIDVFVAKANMGYQTLEHKEQLRDILFQQAMATASGAAFNPIALLTTAGAVLGLGATVDNVRKRKEIKRLST